MHHPFFVVLCIFLTVIQRTNGKRCRAWYDFSTTTESIMKVNCENRYPGLPIEAAVCPESFGDTNFFYISDYYKNIPRCFGLQPVPSTAESVNDLIEACQQKDPDALPASIHSSSELNFLNQRSMANALFGLYLSPGNPISTHLTNIDCTPADYYPISTSVKAITITSFAITSIDFAAVNISSYASSGSQYVICSTYATPRLPNYWLQPQPAMPDLTEYMCEGDGWTLAAPCGGTPSCYQTLALPAQMSNSYTNMYFSQFNYCGTVYENSFVASEHCEKEHQILKNFTGTNGIGLYIGFEIYPTRYSSWQWADGSPFWWAHWDSHSPSNSFSSTSYQTQVNSSSDIVDIQKGLGGSVICKKPAVTTSLPLAVPQYDSFIYEGKTCRIEPAMHWNRRCPTDRDDWIIVESESGVYCYLATTPSTQLTSDNFNEICEAVNPNATLGSIHDDIQIGMINNRIGGSIVVGLIYQSGSYVWADGTPFNKSYFTAAELAKQGPNTVVTMSTVQRKNLCADYKDYQCANTMTTSIGYQVNSMSSISTSQKILCKIEATPIVPCAPMPDADGMDSLNNTICDDGWTKKRLCGKVQCYLSISIPSQYQSLQAGVENDMCSALYPGSFLASIHCIEEHYYVQSYSPCTLIGLHIPSNQTFDFQYFQWSDGTPLDFVGWNRYSDPITPLNRQEPMYAKTPQTYPYGTCVRTVRNKILAQVSGWTNKNYNEFEAALCKKRATII